MNVDHKVAEAVLSLAYTQSHPISPHCSPLLALLAPCLNPTLILSFSGGSPHAHCSALPQYGAYLNG